MHQWKHEVCVPLLGGQRMTSAVIAATEPTSGDQVSYNQNRTAANQRTSMAPSASNSLPKVFCTAAPAKPMPPFMPAAVRVKPTPLRPRPPRPPRPADCRRPSAGTWFAHRPWQMRGAWGFRVCVYNALRQS